MGGRSLAESDTHSYEDRVRPSALGEHGWFMHSTCNRDFRGSNPCPSSVRSDQSSSTASSTIPISDLFPSRVARYARDHSRKGCKQRRRRRPRLRRRRRRPGGNAPGLGPYRYLPSVPAVVVRRVHAGGGSGGDRRERRFSRRSRRPRRDRGRAQRLGRVLDVPSGSRVPDRGVHRRAGVTRPFSSTEGIRSFTYMTFEPGVDALPPLRSSRPPRSRRR